MSQRDYQARLDQHRERSRHSGNNSQTAGGSARIYGHVIKPLGEMTKAIALAFFVHTSQSQEFFKKFNRQVW